jgi:glycosyltransferase involved in cell wall biosynthesis
MMQTLSNSEHSGNLTVRKLRILHLVPTFNIGGVETLLVSMAPHWSLDRYDVGVCFFNAGERLYVDRLRDCGLSIHDIGVGRRGRVHFGVVPRLCSLLRGLGIDIVHTHTISAQVYALAARRLIRRTLVVAHQHRLPTRLQLRIRPLVPLIGHPDVTIAVSQTTRQAVLSQLHVPADAVSLVYNGITRVEAPAVAASDGLRLFTVARLSPEKGIAFLVDAMRIIHDVVPRATLAIIGDGVARERLERQVRGNSLEHIVSFLGLHQWPAELVRQFDVFVLPSLEEGLPLSLLEAMAHGKPVVATAVGGVPEVVANGRNGLIVPPADPPALAAAIVRVLTDRALRARLIAGAIDTSETFDVRRTATEIEAIYASLAATHLGLAFDQERPGWVRVASRRAMSGGSTSAATTADQASRTVFF